MFVEKKNEILQLQNENQKRTKPHAWCLSVCLSVCQEQSNMTISEIIEDNKALVNTLFSKKLCTIQYEYDMTNFNYPISKNINILVVTRFGHTFNYYFKNKHYLFITYQYTTSSNSGGMLKSNTVIIIIIVMNLDKKLPRHTSQVNDNEICDDLISLY